MKYITASSFWQQNYAENFWYSDRTRCVEWLNLGIVLRGALNFGHAKFSCEKSSRSCSNFYAPLKHECLGIRYRHIAFLTCQKFSLLPHDPECGGDEKSVKRFPAFRKFFILVKWRNFCAPPEAAFKISIPYGGLERPDKLVKSSKLCQVVRPSKFYRANRMPNAICVR